MKTGNDLELLLSWYEIRDVLLGVNKRAIFKQALKIAESCQYPDAVWLTKLFTGRDVSTLEDAKNVFLESDDFRAPCFAAVILDQAEFQPEEKELLRRSADMGYGFAQSWMAGLCPSQAERFEWARRASEQFDRDGLFLMALFFERGVGCAVDLVKAKSLYLFAAQLGRPHAMLAYALLLDESDIQRYVWLKKVADVFHRDPSMSSQTDLFWPQIVDEVNKLGSGCGRGNVVFAIGRALNGHVDQISKQIFGTGWNFDAVGAQAQRAVDFFNFQLQSYRKAVNTWTHVGLRNRVVKDIRKMIGKMIWDAREEAAYLEDQESESSKKAERKKRKTAGVL